MLPRPPHAQSPEPGRNTQTPSCLLLLPYAAPPPAQSQGRNTQTPRSVSASAEPTRTERHRAAESQRLTRPSPQVYVPAGGFIFFPGNSKRFADGMESQTLNLSLVIFFLLLTTRRFASALAFPRPLIRGNFRQRSDRRFSSSMAESYTGTMSDAAAAIHDVSETPTEATAATRHFHVSPFLQSSTDSGTAVQPKTTSVLILLNSPISNPPSRIFHHLWERSAYRVCADGGANRLYDATTAVAEGAYKQPQKPLYVPDLIKGDLDSLLPSVKEHYEMLGSAVDRDPCQDTNDLDKALQSVVSWRNNLETCKSPSQMSVYVYGAFGGRFDQEMASMQALYKWADEFRYNVTLYSDETCSFLLPAGVANEVRLPSISNVSSGGGNINRVGEGPTCGLIPLGCRCDSVKTTGLKWNLDGSIPLEFGGLVSTSNRIVDDVVTIESSQPLVFTTEMVGGA